MGVNKVILLGNLGRDPELRFTANNTPVATFSLATTERRKDASGQWSDHTEWHNVVVFGKTAENCNQYLKKGRQAFVEGRIQTRKWQDKEGKDRYTTEVVAMSVQFVGGGKDAGQGPGRSQYQVEEAPAARNDASDLLPSADALSGAAGGASAAPMFDDDDIPF